MMPMSSRWVRFFFANQLIHVDLTALGKALGEGSRSDLIVDDYDWRTVSVAEADRGGFRWLRRPHGRKDVGGHLDPVLGVGVGPCGLDQLGNDAVHVHRSELRGLGDLRDERAKSKVAREFGHGSNCAWWLSGLIRMATGRRR